MPDTGLSNSFIPQDASKTPRFNQNGGGGGLIDLAFILSVVLLVTSGALYGAVFMYHSYLTSQNVSAEQQIQTVNQNLDTKTVDAIMSIDQRMNAAQTLIGNHLAYSAFFNNLNQATLTSIQFSSFKIDSSDQTKGIVLSLSGVARDLNGVAYEAQLFGLDSMIKNPIFSGIALDTDGVHFVAAATIDPKQLSYETQISGGQSQAASTGTQTAAQAQSQAVPQAVTPTAASSGGSASSTPPAQQSAQKK